MVFDDGAHLQTPIFEKFPESLVYNNSKLYDYVDLIILNRS